MLIGSGLALEEDNKGQNNTENDSNEDELQLGLHSHLVKDETVGNVS